MWAYAIHRDPKYFHPLTNTFWPERWLNQDEYVSPMGDIISSNQVVTTKEVFMPFSLGPMVCVGKGVALMEIRAVLCALVQHFDVKIVDQTALDTWEEKIGENFTTIKGNLPVHVTPRYC
jgi:cytochrome P450